MSALASKPKRIYLDYNATSPLADGVADAVANALLSFGNPSSQHAEGRAALRVIEEARTAIAQSLGATALDLVFTSGGTEANHLGLFGLARLAKAERNANVIGISPTVHPSLWAAAESLRREGFILLPLPVTKEGTLDVSAAKERVSTEKIAVIACSLANHELGAIENSNSVNELAASCNAFVFCDAVQAYGRMPLSLPELGFAGVSVSSHKIGGPKGVGALWLRPGLQVLPTIGGGKQESGRRPGTQATPLIAGFSAAAMQIKNRLHDVPRQEALRLKIMSSISEIGGVVLSPTKGLCNTICAQVPGIAGDILVSSLDLKGIAISTGAACSSGAHLPSPVMLGIGLNTQAAMEIIRVSVGPQTTEEECLQFGRVLSESVQRIRQFC